ncbi:hypothetical protein K2173_009773 [Erythroxylum novogranatense]|uniref:Tafazzin family protein n=1 Tax=Erythroxylum novogranatense TaxID=1862640 RepID=A0AAV8SYW4_9ROSI|nr:hypothetical protein K2173_009773 [Erythroxylum novogranatense]
MGRTMEWAAASNHLRGIPRKTVFMLVGAFAKVVANVLNTTSVHNADTLVRLVQSRPPGVPLLLSVIICLRKLDDPVMWGFNGFPTTNSELGRWVLTAEDICFKNPVYSYVFRTGKCIPITRGGGIYQEHMNEALERLGNGEWLHTFPEGKVCQTDAPIRRLKWGTASLITRSSVPPIVLPIIHQGFEEKAPVPLCNKKINIVVGEPINFDLPNMRQVAITMSRNLSLPKTGWMTTRCGLDEAAQMCLYTSLSEKIQAAMESLRIFGKNLLKENSKIHAS